jgi:intracellular sulfur oxidation DsrE/DsrF family protein
MNSDDSHNNRTNNEQMNNKPESHKSENHEPVNNEQINAYVDDQLSTGVKAEILKKSQDDNALADDICQTRVLKEMVKLAYHTPPDSRARLHSDHHSPSRWSYGIAASLLILVGSISGWYGALYYGNAGLNPLSLSQLPTESAETISNHRVLLHISTDEPSRVDTALNNAERLLAKNNSNEKFQLQILVNAEGIKILQQSDSPYIERIQTLANSSENLSLVACQRSIERQKLMGVDVHLVKEARVIPEALAEIVSRLQQGWVYIRT